MTDAGVSPGLIQRNRSWSKGREVSWDEMGSLGLHKALNEYYKVGACAIEQDLCDVHDLSCCFYLSSNDPALLRWPRLVQCSGA